MPNEATVGCKAPPVHDEALIDTLIALSVVAKKLAAKLQKENMEGEKEHEQDE